MAEFLNSDLVKYLVKSTKWSNFETCKQVFWNIANPKKIKNMNPKTIYKYFELDEDEIAIIKK